jgi:hypothetical protein
VTHCSVEDAVTALALYKKYLELKASDSLIEALNGLYEQVGIFGMIYFRGSKF